MMWQTIMKTKYRFYRKLKSITVDDKSGYEIEYKKVPNGTWWIN